MVSTPGGSPAPPPASISAFRQPEHGRNQQASQVKQHGRSPPGQLEPHVCPHAVKSLAAIAYTQQTSCTWEPVFDSRQNFQAEPCQRPVRTWRGKSRWTTSRLYPWCPSPRSRSHQWKGGLQRSRSRNNPMRSKNHRPRSPGSMLMGQPVRGFQDRQAPRRETAPLGVQRCGRRSQDSSSLDFMVARTPSSELFRHGLAVSAPWIFATAPRLQNDCESSAWTSLHRQPPIILASAIRPYTMPGQVPPGRTTNIHSRGKVVSTPGLDPRVPCMQLSPSFRLVRSLDLPTLHDQNISHYREVLARHGTQQHSWFCPTVRMGLTTTPAHTSGIPSPTPSGYSILRGPVQLSLAMVPSPSSKRKSSRRLPSYLRNQVGAEPVGELRRLREEAANAAIERDRIRNLPNLHSPRPAQARPRREAGERGERGFRALVCPLELELVMMNLSNPSSHMDTPHPARESEYWRSRMSRPRPDGLRREVGERRVSGFCALIEPREMELVPLHLNNPWSHMDPTRPARGSDHWRHRLNWCRMGRVS